jgi:glycerophosphoryl diester phosphodiesterase
VGGRPDRAHSSRDRDDDADRTRNVLTDVRARPVIAHRGNSAHAPENTLESFDQAMALSADALELDVRLSRDGIPVVIHDPTLDRTTNGRGPVSSRTLAELRLLDAGARFTADDGRTFPYRGRSLVIPTLAELLGRYPDVPLLIEVKEPHAVEATRRELEQSRATARVLVDSTLHEAVAPFRGGALATGASLPDVVRLLRDSLVRRSPDRLPYEALCIPRWYHGVRVPVALLARTAARAQTATHVWTINDVALAVSLWRAGVHGIITDDPGPILEARRRIALPVEDS